jgi:hypothetical protein
MARLYAIYRGDTFIDLGTVRELAERLKFNEDTIRHMATPTHFRRTKYDVTLRAYRIEEQDEVIE